MQINWFIYINGFIFMGCMAFVLGYMGVGVKMAIALLTAFTFGILLWSGVI